MSTRDRPRASSCAPSLQPMRTIRMKASSNTDQYRLGNYQLGAEIGKGGFGTVFAALDIETGRSVAIKRVSLHDIDQDDLSSIESEIRLLKKLNHENIVKYYDTIKTEDYLHIVLEYMENGSLAQVVKKFGALSETLIAMYISQVLLGLAYLHDQGVLHRDIKGANILTTKDGLVKLADFGVAIKVNESQASNNVVGTPYWMAPEVIEMSGCSAASDIWSVGCTVIELLTTKAPYFDLSPMQALFRIVQDDYPPLPEGISPAMRDFIIKCFMKEPRLRLSAQELLRHPWIKNIPRNKVRQSTELVEAYPAPDDAKDAMLNTIKLYSKVADPTTIEEKCQVEREEDWDEEFQVQLELPPKHSLDDASAGEVMNTMEKNKAITFKLCGDEANELDECFDEDQNNKEFPTIVRKSGSSSTGIGINSLSSTIPPGSSSEEVLPTGMLSKGSKLFRFQEQVNEGEFQEFNDLDFENRPLGNSDPLEELEEHTDLSLKLRKFLSGSMKSPNWDGGAEESLFEDNLFDELDFEQAPSRDANAKQTARILELLALLQPNIDDRLILDACQELHKIFMENPDQRRQLMSYSGVIPNIMEALEVKKTDVLHAVLEVVNLIIQDNKKFQENMALIGLVPVIVKLSALKVEHFGSKSVDIKLEAAKFVRQSCKTSTLTLQMFIACGGLPVLVDLLDISRIHQHSVELVRIALDGIMGVFTLQTIPKNDFCRLFVKVGLLKKLIVVFKHILNNLEHKTLMEDFSLSYQELQKICDIFILFSQGDTVVKVHMCELVVVQGIMHALNPELLRRQDDTFKVENRIHTSTPTLSSSSPTTTSLLPTPPSSSSSSSSSSMLPPPPPVSSIPLTTNSSNVYQHKATLVITKLLKCVRNLSMDPNTLDKLDHAGAIPTLVRLLDHFKPASASKDIHNHVLHTMFYLCRINRNRQTQAAQAGIIPFLQRVTTARDPLKQFALPILCDLAHASPTARAQLWACQGVDFFLDLLSDRYWQRDSMNSLAVWLIHNLTQVENVLLKPSNLIKIINIFRVDQVDFENLLEPILEVLTKSVRLNQALGRSGLFVADMVDRLQYPKAIVRKNILKVLKSLFEAHRSPKQFILEYNLYPIVQQLAQDDNMILVMEIASQFLQAIAITITS